MLTKEVKRNPALVAMLEKQDNITQQVKQAKKSAQTPREKNPRAYERNRGKGGAKPMSYYLPEEIIVALNIRAAKERKTKSEIVLSALQVALQDELK